MANLFLFIRYDTLNIQKMPAACKATGTFYKNSTPRAFISGTAGGTDNIAFDDPLFAVFPEKQKDGDGGKTKRNDRKSAALQAGDQEENDQTEP